MTWDKSKKVLVGVVGRLGAGKSSFARMLAEQGAKLLDADKLAWKLYSNPTIMKDLKVTFLNKVFDLHGKVDRKKLGEIVFRDPLALKRLNAIVHPPLIGELEYLISKTAEPVVVIDAALLLDWPLAEACEVLIAVVADEETSIARKLKKRMRRKRSEAILANQRPEAEFRSLCHVVVENSGDLEDLRKKAARVWQEYVAPLVV